MPSFLLNCYARYSIDAPFLCLVWCNSHKTPEVNYLNPGKLQVLFQEKSNVVIKGRSAFYKFFFKAHLYVDRSVVFNAT